MEYNPFGCGPIKVSKIGLGCQSLTGTLWQRDDREARRVLDQAFDSGINFYDTADMYALGRSERLIGQAFKGKRDRVMIATKVGYVFTRLGKLGLQLSPFVSPASFLLKPFRITLNRLHSSLRFHDFSSTHTQHGHKL